MSYCAKIKILRQDRQHHHRERKSKIVVATLGERSLQHCLYRRLHECERTHLNLSLWDESGLGRSNRTGHYPCRPTTAGYRGTPGTTFACGMGLGSWVLPMEREPICLGAWKLGQPAPTWGGVDSGPMGASRRWLCLRRRILALTRMPVAAMPVRRSQQASVKVQREPGYELERVLLVSDLRIIQEVIDGRYGKSELLVDGQSQRAGAGGGEGARVVPGYVGQKFFIKMELAPLPRVRLGQCRSDQVKIELRQRWRLR